MLCDAFSGAFAKNNGEHLRRKEWADLINVALPELMPGGWSAKGQPCDKVHGHWRRGCDMWTDHCMRFAGPLFKRPRFEELVLTSIGIAQHEAEQCDKI